MASELRQAVRAVAAAPVPAVLAMLALTLGIGAGTAVFSVVHAVLLRPLPHFRDAGRVMQIWGSTPSKGVPFHQIPYADLSEIRRQAHSFETLAAVAPGAGNLTGPAGGDPERIAWYRVNHGLFAVAGAEVAVGRGFSPADDRPGAPPVAVLSYTLWQRRFAANPAAVGSTILLDGNPYQVAGVTPRGFTLPGQEIDLYTPLALPDTREAGAATGCTAIARLKDGIAPEQAQAELDTVLRRLQQDYHVETGRLQLWVLRDFVVRDLRTAVTVLLGAVGLVLLIACANVANLLLSRGAAREREIAVRMALGASRARIAFQLITESAVLAAAGAIPGVAAAYWGVRLLPRLVPGRMPFVAGASVDTAVLAFSIALVLLTALLGGVAPALAAARRGNLHDALKQGSRTGEGRGHLRVRSALVVAEVALSLILLVGAGLLIRSFSRLVSVSPGFDSANVLSAAVTLPAARYPNPAAREAFFRKLLDRLDTSPGVAGAGATSVIPLSGDNNGVVVFVEGRPLPRRGELPIVWYRSISPGYLRALRVPLRAGRAFSAFDSREAPPVAMVNETMARRFWPGENALGKRFSFRPPQPGQPPAWITVIGILADLRHRSLSGPPDAELYLAYTQGPFSPGYVVVRTTADPDRFAGLLRAAVRAVDPDLPVSKVRSLEQVVSDSTATPRLSVVLLAAFAAIALLLAAIGIYGVVSFSVARRTREIGIRMAMGALPRDVLRSVVGHSLALALAGVSIGAAGAVALTRVLRSLLFGVSPTDPLVFAAVALLLIAVAALAGWMPARRAAALDPLTALREE